MNEKRNEIQSFVTAMAASGGIIMLSDKLPNLKPDQLDMLSKLFPQNTQSAVPLDIMENNYPRVLDFGYRGKTRIVAFINWEDSVKRISVDINRSYVFEFWSQSYLGIYDKEFGIDINPHCSKVFFFTDFKPAAVIGTDSCICFENRYDFNDGVLSSQFLKKSETVFAASDTPLEAVKGCSVQHNKNNIYRITSLGEAKEFIIKQA
jgi:hypothetical protein